MDTGLKGRTVLITGASRNLGRYASLAFAGEGANLALCTSARMKELGEVADAARAKGVKVLAEKCDVTDSAAVAGFVKKTRDQFGGVDVAINIAGYRAESPFLEATMEEWNRAIDVNLAAPLHICRAVLPLMMEKKWGRIINISGVSPYLGGSAIKAMVKLGIVAFTRGIARDFPPHNITANCVGPGHVRARGAGGAGEREAGAFLAADPAQRPPGASQDGPGASRQQGRQLHHRPVLPRQRRAVLSVAGV